MKHSEYIKVVTDLGKDTLKKAIMAGVVKQLPLLASGPWNFVLVKLTSWIAEQAFEEAEMRIFFKFIDFRTDIQAKDFEAAMLYNHTIQKIGTEQEKKDAEAKLTDALNRLVSLRS